MLICLVSTLKAKLTVLPNEGRKKKSVKNLSPSLPSIILLSKYISTLEYSQCVNMHTKIAHSALEYRRIVDLMLTYHAFLSARSPT